MSSATANDSINQARGRGRAGFCRRNARRHSHGTMLALSKADIELRLVGNIRNKVVGTFYELWRMQI